MIKFLITRDSISRLHRIPFEESWHFYEGDGNICIVELDDKCGNTKITKLGKDEETQYVVKSNVWFGCYADEGTSYALVGCCVSPGFDFRDFELASPNRLRKQFPNAVALINKMTIGLPELDEREKP